ncbi:hypothetical protein IFM89_004234 [Coptis chinensis]|uniref:Pentatricopeptide repeat-containing protein n=1 Tax=Coptis chinensis TaxID=261450 RepID=A0A835I914_9MAGN|nr:hypothetical protein IFM89_004234 [Coptis chinensis]
MKYTWRVAQELMRVTPPVFGNFKKTTKDTSFGGFEMCCVEDVVCWNAMIDGYVKYSEMELAKLVFERMVCRDVVSWNTMINGYPLVGSIKEAKRLFDEMPERNVVYWNSMLAWYGFALHGCKAIIDMKEKERPVYPAVMNDETLHEHVEMVGRHLLGSENVKLCNKVLASEDFAFYQEVIPGVMFSIGIINEELGSLPMPPPDKWQHSTTLLSQKASPMALFGEPELSLLARFEMQLSSLGNEQGSLLVKLQVIERKRAMRVTK